MCASPPPISPLCSPLCSASTLMVSKPLSEMWVLLLLACTIAHNKKVRTLHYGGQQWAHWQTPTVALSTAEQRPAVTATQPTAALPLAASAGFGYSIVRLLDHRRALQVHCYAWCQMQKVCPADLPWPMLYNFPQDLPAH